MSSVQKNYLQSINKNKIPGDLYRDKVFVYKLFDNESGDRVFVLQDLLATLLADPQIKQFIIEEYGILEGKFSDDQQLEVTTNKQNPKIRSSVEIPNLNTNNFNLGDLYLFSKKDLSEFVNVETGAIRLPIGVVPFISTGIVNLGLDGTFYTKLQAFDSFQWSYIDSTGVEVNTIIRMTFNPAQGVNVSHLLVERYSYADLSRNSIVILDDNNLSISYSIDFDKSSKNFLGDLDHVEIAVDPNNQVDVFSHSYSGFRLLDWMIENADVFLGIHPDFEIINDFGGQEFANADNKYIMNNNNINDQLNLEFVTNAQYYRFIYNYRGTGVTDLQEDWKDDHFISQIIPQNVINNLSILRSETLENNPVLQNENKNEEYWFSSDYKTDELTVVAGILKQNYAVDFTKAKSIKDNNLIRAKQLLNGFHGGSLITYKGMIINELPDILDSQNKGNYQDFSSSNQDEVDFYVATTYPLINSFNSRKSVFDVTNPIQTTQERVYGVNLYDRTKPWPTSSAFQKLSKNKNLLFVDTKIIFEMINLNQPNISFKTFSARQIGGGSKIKITQLDSNFNRSVDIEGVPVPTIVLPTNWFLNENQRLTVTSFSFISSSLYSIFGKDVGKDVLNNRKLFNMKLTDKYSKTQLDVLWKDRKKTIIYNPTEIQKELYNIKLPIMEYNYVKDIKTEKTEKILIKKQWWEHLNKES